MNAGAILDRNVEAGRSEKTAVVTADDRSLTYGELHRAVCRFASRLAAAGVRREQRILVVLDDTPAFPTVFLGAMRAGAVPVPVNFLSRVDDFGYFLDDSYAVMAVVDGPFVERVGPQVASRSGVRMLVANDEGDETLDAWLEDGEDEFDPVNTHREDMAFWLYSSGSTGRPKGVVHQHHDIADTCENYAVGVLGVAENDVHFSSTKMFHAYGLGNNLTFPIWAGGTAVYLTGRPAPGRLLDRIEAQRPTLFFSVPTLYNAMMSLPGFASRDLSSLRLAVSAAEALPAEVWRRFHDATGVEILDGVGSTELLHIYCSNQPGDVTPGSSGVPVSGYEVEVRDEGGIRLPVGESGELWVRGPSALAQYWHRTDKTRSALVGDWFRSGDRYHEDEDGHFWYEGRVDDMMKVGGLWVSPVEIEARLMEHEMVTEAAVVGVVEEDGLTTIKAHVILTEADAAGDDLTADLQDWCKQALQRYQYPHHVAYVADFPRTTTGKIQRFKLRELG